MQAVGRNCERCGQRIAMALEGDACVRCDKAFHLDCLAGNRQRELASCPLCGLGFQAQQRTVEVAKAVAYADVQTRGGPREQRFAKMMVVVSAAVIGLVHFTHHGEPSHMAYPEVLPFVAAAGLYYVVCSMRFRTFFLYRLQAARAVRWYGAPIAHGAYLLMGLALLVFAFLGWGRSLPFSQ